jgi:type III pantothenate kinase
MLLLDVGNSRIKWILVEKGVWAQQGVTDRADAAALRETFSALPEPHKILVSNVAGERAAQHVRAACAAWACPVEFVTARAEQCGVRNTYEQPEQLGCDRWAALIAAWHKVHAACLVVTCGTATTVDALSSEGEFLGGLILPGPDMMQHSLVSGTAQLGRNRSAEAAGGWREFPRSTADAICSGAIQATAGAIRLQFEALSKRGAVHCLLSGGAADRVQPHLNLPLERIDNLVLQGLQIIGQQDFQATIQKAEA